MPNLLTQSMLSDALTQADLTDPRYETHAMQILLESIHTALAERWQCNRQLIRSCPVVPLENNYDRLGYPGDGAARDERYTRYVSDQLILRTQTSCAIPDLLSGLNVDPPKDLLLILPGLVYRRDSIDRLHCGEPHQLDLWRIVDRQSGVLMSFEKLEEMIATVLQAALPEKEWRISESPHPYTEQGVQIDVLWHGEWVEIGECGLVARPILDNASLNNHTGLAMGLGMDRLLMLRKNVPDIRLLRNQDPRIRAQMNDLTSYRPVSVMPAIRRDLSLCIEKSLNEEEIGDILRSQLPEVDCIESLDIISETSYSDLPPAAHKRMGMQPGHKNILLRLIIRHIDKSLTDKDANGVRNKVYKLLHEGINMELANDG